MNIYEILSSIPHNEHYLKRYLKFIANFKVNVHTKFKTEAHHIVPKCLFSEYSDLKCNPWNKAILPARCHFIAHWMLYKIYDSPKLTLAFNAMNNQKSQCRTNIKQLTGKAYSILRERAVGAISKSNSGRRYSEETNKKKSLPGDKNGMFGVHRYGKDAPRWNKPASEETKKLLSDKAKLRPKLQCPHCGILCNQINAIKHHFDICKHNPNLDIAAYNIKIMLGRVCRIVDHKEMDIGNYTKWINSCQTLGTD